MPGLKSRFDGDPVRPAGSHTTTPPAGRNGMTRRTFKQTVSLLAKSLGDLNPFKQLLNPTNSF